jgi:cysteine-rich repeat protein
VALFCVPATSNPAVNSAGGITGPGAVRMVNYLKVCRCGDGIVGCDEQCEDNPPNTVNGDGCSDLCQIE